MLNSSINPYSNSPTELSVIRSIARSIVLITSRLRAIRFSPSIPSSSIPAVSINTTAPSPPISIFFETGSVVVPATSETIATSCPARAFMSELFPLFRLPNIPICGRTSFPFFILYYLLINRWYKPTFSQYQLTYSYQLIWF